MIITVPVHIRKIHHTKTVYKIIEKPVYPDINQLSGFVSRPQSSGVSEVSKPDADFLKPASGNDNKTNSYDVHSGRANVEQGFEKIVGHQYESQSKNEPKGKYGLDFIPTGYLGHGNKFKETYGIDHSLKGYQQHRGYKGEEEREGGLWRNHGENSSRENYGRSAYKHYGGGNSIQRIHPVVEDTAESSHGRSALQYSSHGQAHHGNGVGDAIIWHVGDTSHVTDLRHGHFGNVRQVSSQKNDGDPKLEHVTNPKHGRTGDVWRVSGQKQGGGSGHKIEHVIDPKHGHVGNVWRFSGQKQGGGGGQKLEHVTDPKHGHIGDLMRVNGQKLGNGGGGHIIEHVTSPKHGHFGDTWRGQNVQKSFLRPYHGKNTSPVSFIRVRHNNGNNGSAYRSSGAGYQVQENTADFDRLISTIPPQMKMFLSATHRNYTLPTGRGDTLHGMSSISSIALPPTIKNVYYTLDPVVPYDDVTKTPKS